MHIDTTAKGYSERFKEFFQGYMDENGRFVYTEQVQKMVLEGLTSLYVNYDDILRYDPGLAQMIRDEPETMFVDADEALFEVISIEDLSYAQENRGAFKVRFANIPDVVDLRHVRATHLGKFISIEGIVLRQSVVKPLLVQGIFQCTQCGEIMSWDQDLGYYSEPSQCSNPDCRKKGSFKLLPEESTYTDVQTITIQEKPENLPPGQIPRSLPAYLVGDLVDVVRAGDRAIINGILRMKPSLQQKKKQLATFDPWLEVNYAASRQKEFEEIEIDPDTEKQILELAKDINIHNKIVRSIAPSIYGHEIIKEAIATVLFGGVSRVTPDGMKQRGESNLLLVGDPGVGKCLSPDEEVVLGNGEIRKIGDIVEEMLSTNLKEIDDGYYAEGNLPIFTMEENGKVKLSNANIFWKRKAPEKMFKIRTATGKEITVTPTHPFFITKDGYIISKETQKLKIGDFIATPRKIPVNAYDKLESEVERSEEKEKSNSNQDIIPGIGKLLLEIRKALNFQQTQMGISPSTEQHDEREDKDPSRETLQLVVSELKKHSNSSEIQRLEKLAFSDIFWDQIVEIKEVKPEYQWVYDLQVPGTHNFVANGIFVHNSQLLHFANRLAPRGIFTSGRASSAAGLCVAADSNIFFHNKIEKISDIVEKEFNQGEIKNYRDGFQYVENSNNEYKILNSKNLKIRPSSIKRFWKIKSPEKLVRITSKTGRTIKLTPQTPLLSLNKEGLVWIPAGKLIKGDKIGTIKHIPIENSKYPPLITQFLKNYEGTVVLYDLEEKVSEIILSYCNKNDLTEKEIASLLELSEDTVYNWIKKERRGTITFNQLEKLCKLANIEIEEVFPELITLEIKQGKTFVVPKKLDEKWFYILGLIMANGRVHTTKGNKLYQDITIGLSNRDYAIRKHFEDFVESLGLNITKTIESKSRLPEFRVHSKFVYHIFKYFGLAPSSNPADIEPNLEMLYYDKKLLASFLRGIYDAEGWISQQTDNRVQIGFESISEKLADFVQLALSVFGIISFKRVKKTKRGRQNEAKSKHKKYCIEFSDFDSVQQFYNEISFSHPKKGKKLENYFSNNKEYYSNINTIPNIREWLKEIFDFYNLSTKEIFGQRDFLKSSNKISISKNILKKAISNVELNFEKHSVRIENERMKEIYNLLQQHYSKSEIKEKLCISENNFQYLFNNVDKPIYIEIELLRRFIRLCEINENTLTFLENKIHNEEEKHERYLHKWKLIKAIIDEDVFWDEVKSIDTIKSENENVYDLTVPNTHNFIVNGFITHNTAAVIRDPDTGEFSLEAGALVLADRGLATIDEFDKMTAHDRSAIHEAMEQHTVSIAKAGIVAQLNARTAIIAAANPKFGRYEESSHPVDNINLPATIVSRFDLIYIMRDLPEKDSDLNMARHILELRRGQLSPSIEPPIPMDLLRKYISYAKQNVEPALTDEAMRRIEQFYLELRKQSDKKSIAITPRYLEAIIRLSEAQARMALKEDVTIDHAEAAIRLLTESLQQVGRDPVTGKVDVDYFLQGTSRSERSNLQKVIDIIKEETRKSYSNEVTISKVKQIAEKEHNIDGDFVDKVIRQLSETGELYSPREGKVRLA